MDVACAHKGVGLDLFGFCRSQEAKKVVDYQILMTRLARKWRTYIYIFHIFSWTCQRENISSSNEKEIRDIAIRIVVGIGGVISTPLPVKAVNSNV